MDLMEPKVVELERQYHLTAYYPKKLGGRNITCKCGLRRLCTAEPNLFNPGERTVDCEDCK